MMMTMNGSKLKLKEINIRASHNKTIVNYHIFFQCYQLYNCICILTEFIACSLNYNKYLVFKAWKK